MLKLSDFDAITFDVYGTLIDWEPSIVAFLRDWAGRKGLTQSDEALIMAFDGARAVIQKARPAYLYPEVLRRSFDRISVDFGVALEAADREAFAKTPHDWPAFPDSHKRPQGTASPGQDRRAQQYRRGLAGEFLPQARLPIRYRRDG